MFRNEQMVDIIAGSPRVDDSICVYVGVNQYRNRNEKVSGKTFFVALMNSPIFPWSTGGRFLVTLSKNPAFDFAMSATFDIPCIHRVVKSHLRVNVFRLWRQFDDLVEQVVPSP